MHKLDKIALKILEDRDLPELVLGIVETAFDIFQQCHAESDFCFQVVSSSVIVFGSNNRLIWSPALGFRPDASYCTPGFLFCFNQL
jgi:hypothetical protein